MLKLRRILAAVCYAAMLAADAAEIYIIYLSIHGGITYYFGMLLFLPIFIFTYWMSTFFAQLSYGKVELMVHGRVRKKRIMPKKLRGFLNFLSSAISFLLALFWIVIYVMLMFNEAVNENLTENNLAPEASIISMEALDE